MSRKVQNVPAVVRKKSGALGILAVATFSRGRNAAKQNAAACALLRLAAGRDMPYGSVCAVFSVRRAASNPDGRPARSGLCAGNLNYALSLNYDAVKEDEYDQRDRVRGKDAQGTISRARRADSARRL